jgi:hypothetical protein
MTRPIDEPWANLPEVAATPSDPAAPDPAAPDPADPAGPDRESDPAAPDPEPDPPIG